MIFILRLKSGFQLHGKGLLKGLLEEMASVAVVAGSAGLLRTLIGLAKDTGGADQAMAMALLGSSLMVFHVFGGEF